LFSAVELEYLTIDKNGAKNLRLPHTYGRSSFVVGVLCKMLQILVSVRSTMGMKFFLFTTRISGMDRISLLQPQKRQSRNC